LPAVLRGDDRPASATEVAAFAQLSQAKELYVAAARFWGELSAGGSEVMGDLSAGYRYNAACAAALAGSGRGKDAVSIDEAARAKLRRQAVVWLEADLAGWAKVLKDGPPEKCTAIIPLLRHWKADEDLACLRDALELAGLPEAERDACRKLWGEVDSLWEDAAFPADPFAR
jgi:hypothetical protein